MLPRTLRNPLLLAVVLSLAALLAFAACGDDEEEEEPTPTTAAQTPSDGETPQVIDISGVPELEDGVLTVGSDIAYAPIEFYEEGTQNAMGMDIDLMTAMADILGVDVEFLQVADFGAIVEDLKTQRYDIVMSAISVTAEREAEIDLIPYFGPVGTGILVQSGNPKGIDAVEDLCGLKVAAQVGTYQVIQVEGSAEEGIEGLNQTTCANNQIQLTTFPQNPEAVQELTLGRVDAELADDPVAAYSVSQSDGAVELAAVGFDAAPYGIGVRKESSALRAVLEAALARIMDDGTYLEILQDWAQEQFALQ